VAAAQNNALKGGPRQFGASALQRAILPLRPAHFARRRHQWGNVLDGDNDLLRVFPELLHRSTSLSSFVCLPETSRCERRRQEGCPARLVGPPPPGPPPPPPTPPRQYPFLHVHRKAVRYSGAVREPEA